ncbi:retropepsin-like aspartic protease family protein [Sphingopyxis sp.]|uniref:retropepsin-like aspartic protease family protein n=1 Tax=Sphingopyxis sp. TaxID=1908224 RepID=UPI002D79C4F7|nr:TIGR02281 family clan AA aspartic protease [Sphingopyxis sp.]HET6525608.1 TIGR02281 family clan AA aspartic protease [Sphingopyxis sp.]
MAIAITAVSVGVASVASRSAGDGDGARVPAETQHDSNWTTRKRERGAWSSGSSAPGARASGGEVRLGRSGDSHFYADTEVDGTNIRMLVDSGASIVALTRRDAEAIGIDVDSLPIGGMARTAGGDVPMRTVTLGSVVVEGIEVRQVPAAVIDADMGVSLLGQSFLAKLDTVNVEGDTMTLR